MKHRSIAIASFLVFTSLAYSSAMADEIRASTKVSAATIYMDRAEITRQGMASIPVGDHVLTIDGLPDGFDQSSLRIGGKAATAVKIGAIEVRRVHSAALVVAGEREKAAALQAKRDEKSMLDAEVQALILRQKFIERLAIGGADDFYRLSQPMPSSSETSGKMGASILPPPRKGSDLPFETWEKAWNSVQSGMADTRKEIIKRQIMARALDEEIAKLEQEYQKIRTSQRSQNQVRVSVGAKENAEFRFSVTYQTMGASWTSVYDARLNTDKAGENGKDSAASAEIKLEQYGQAMQTTGEDWNDVELTLSTARPDIGAEMPQPSEWYIGAARQQMANRRAMTMALSKAASAEMDENAAGAGYGAVPAAAPVAAEMEQAEVSVGDYMAEFRISGKVDLKSVAETSRFFIGDHSLKAALEAQAVPRLSQAAYLIAVATNDGKTPIMSGPVSKYRDGAFVGNSSLGLLRPGEKTSMAFGIDDRIKVTYQKIKHEQSNPALVYVGDATAERGYRSVIKNMHQRPIRMTVIGQYPVSIDADVKVRLLGQPSTTKGFVDDEQGRPGMISWKTDLQPQEEKTFDIGFSVSAPKGRQLPDF